MIHVQPIPSSDRMSCYAAAAPPFPVIFGKTTRSLLSFTSIPHQNPLKSNFSQYVFLSAFSVALLVLRLTSGVILPHFSQRWRQLIAFSSQAEAELIDAPDYLFDAAIAYEQFLQPFWRRRCQRGSCRSVTICSWRRQHDNAAAYQKQSFEERAHIFEEIFGNGAAIRTREENFEIENPECLLV